MAWQIVQAAGPVAVGATTTTLVLLVAANTRAEGTVDARASLSGASPTP